MAKRTSGIEPGVTEQARRVVWTEFSAFPDVAAIDSLHKRLLAEVKHVRGGETVSLDSLLGEQSELHKRLCAQATQTGAIYSTYVHGGNELAWRSDPFHIIFVVFDELVEKPYRLPDECERLVLLLYRALIFAHEVFDPYHRTALIKQARDEHNLLAAKKPRGSKGIECAIHSVLAEGKSVVTAALAWMRLKKFTSASPFENADFEVYMDGRESSAALISVHRKSGKPDGRSIKLASFGRAFNRAKKSYAIAG